MGKIKVHQKKTRNQNLTPAFQFRHRWTMPHVVRAFATRNQRLQTGTTCIYKIPKWTTLQPKVLAGMIDPSKCWMDRRLKKSPNVRSKDNILLCYRSVWVYFRSNNKFRSSFNFVVKEFFYFLFCSRSQFLFSFSSSFCELLLFFLVLLLVLVHENITAVDSAEKIHDFLRQFAMWTLKSRQKSM